ncbi:hypothetical protein KFL_000570330 [Klebsormidium nitens]|uniref:Uncharacterized protein n=1 Tax=Klebsormidium nitens TaxID=105231 RepID=A0A0U9HJE4_KLENI|nr:hypothetical protein KFL_000570330 [Klebsormidium nitens]|eukprot:GAQ80586.1 hypothetical protein KFL_000570330 [Klebsormidium nitens]
MGVDCILCCTVLISRYPLEMTCELLRRLIVSALELYSYTIRGGVYGFLTPICSGWGKAPAEELLLEAGRGQLSGALDALLGEKEAQGQGEGVVREVEEGDEI